MDKEEFKGKVAFVTGAARGFGKAFAEALCGRGAAVGLGDIDAIEVEKAAASLRESGFDAIASRCDVTDEAEVSAAIGQLTKSYGGLDILINNAGLHSEEFNKGMTQLGLAKVRRLFDVNLMGTINCTLAATPFMEKRAGAAIVNIASSASYTCSTAYGVSKLAVRGLTAAFAREFGGAGIRVNAISPGLILTDTIREELDPNTIARVKGLQILNQEGSVDDIVEAMLYLVSSRSAFVSGETLRVSGGFTLSI